MKFSILAASLALISVASAAAIPQPEAETSTSLVARAAAPCELPSGELKNVGPDDTLFIGYDGPEINGEPIPKCGAKAKPASDDDTSAAKTKRRADVLVVRAEPAVVQAEVVKREDPCVGPDGQLQHVDNGAHGILSIGADGPEIGGKPVKKCSGGSSSDSSSSTTSSSSAPSSSSTSGSTSGSSSTTSPNLSSTNDEKSGAMDSKASTMAVLVALGVTLMMM